MIEFLIFVVAFLAFSVSAVAGGGAGLVLMPVLGMVLPGATVPAALSIGTTTNTIARIFTFYKYIRLDVTLRFIPFALPAVWLGAWLLTYINPLYLELFMGLFLVGNLGLIFKKKGEATSQKTLNKNYLFLIGASAGLVSGLTGAVGLLFNKFYLQLGLTKEEIIATRACNEILLHLIKLVLYTAFGLMTFNAISYGLLIAVAGVFATYMAKFIVNKIDEGTFRKVAYGAMVVSGCTMLSGAAYRISDSNNLGMSFTLASGELETQLQWRQGFINMEFEYDDGFEFEHNVAFQDLPKEIQSKTTQITKGASKVKYEEVFGIGKHYFEVYLTRGGKLYKFDI